MASTAVRVGGPGSRRRDQVRPPVPAGSRRVRLNLSTTPGRLRLLLAILVLLSLAWGALAAFTVQQYASAASGVVATREPLSLDALQIYQRLSDANDAAATAFLTGGLEPLAVRQRYLADIGAAESGLEDATARGGAGNGADLDGSAHAGRSTCPSTPARSRRPAPTTALACRSAPPTCGRPRR